jgi:hypothetical protein
MRTTQAQEFRSASATQPRPSNKIKKRKKRKERKISPVFVY